MLQNISENLRVGGFFIGTTPCAYEIMSRAQKVKFCIGCYILYVQEVVTHFV